MLSFKNSNIVNNSFNCTQLKLYDSILALALDNLYETLKNSTVIVKISLKNLVGVAEASCYVS